MSDLDLTEAVAAAAIAQSKADIDPAVADMSEADFQEHMARAALTAAAPLIERQVRDRIAADIMAAFAKDQRRTAFLDASRIARGKS